MKAPEVLLDAQQVADRLNVSKKWVYEASAKGVLPSGKIGHNLRFRQYDIEQFINRSFD